MTQSLTMNKIAKNNQIFKVYKNLADGMDTQEACRRAGVPYSRYKRWIAENPESIRVISKTIATIERQQLMDVFHASTNILNNLITLSTNTELPPRTQMELHRYLSSIAEKIEYEGGGGAHEDINAKEFLLTGPKTHKAESRTTVNIKPMADGSIDVTVMKAEDIIDAIDSKSQDQLLTQDPQQ
jgi:hypothetical protein